MNDSLRDWVIIDPDEPEHNHLQPDEPAMKPVRVAVVGVGYLGSIHARIYARMEGVELVGVVDDDWQRAEKVAAETQSTPFKDISQLIGRVDAVSVVVPTTLHREVSLPFIDAGIHLLLEKPVAPTVAEAEEIVSAAQSAGIILLVGHLERFNAGVMMLAEKVGRPRFIEVHRLGTFVERATDVDVVTDLMIHDIDIVMELVDDALVGVSAVGAKVVTDQVDIANARLEFKNGVVANVTASRVSNKRFRRIRVFGENGYHALNFADQQIDMVTTGECPPGERYPEIISEKLEVESRPPLDAELEHFVDAVRNGLKPLVSGHQGVEALRVASLVREKIELCLKQ